MSLAEGFGDPDFSIPEKCCRQKKTLKPSITESVSASEDQHSETIGLPNDSLSRILSRYQQVKRGPGP